MDQDKLQLRLWIDADGCPVVKQSISLAKKYKLSVTLVKNHAVNIESDYAQVITVDTSRDAADFYIVNHLHKGDLVITGDYGLAAMALSKGALVISNMGRLVTNDSITFMLESRHHNKMERMKGNRASRIKKRTKEDDEEFSKSLEQILRET